MFPCHNIHFHREGHYDKTAEHLCVPSHMPCADLGLRSGRSFPSNRGRAFWSQPRCWRRLADGHSNSLMQLFSLLCFLFLFFFSCPRTHWQQPVRSDAGRTCSNWTNQWLCVFACMCVLTSMSLQFPSVRCLHCFCSFQSTKSTCCGVT